MLLSTRGGELGILKSTAYSVILGATSQAATTASAATQQTCSGGDPTASSSHDRLSRVVSRGSADLFCLFFCFSSVYFSASVSLFLAFGTQPGGPNCPQPLPRILSCLIFCFFLCIFCFMVTISRLPDFQNLSARLENLSGELDRF